MEFVEGEEPCTDVLPFWTSISSASCAKNSTMKKLLLFKQVDEDILSLLEMTFEEGEKEEKKQSKRKREHRCRVPKGVIRYIDPVNLEVKVLLPTMSSWYNLYCNGVVHGTELLPTFAEKFRRRFRLPYNCYQELLDICNCEAAAGGYMTSWRPGNMSAIGTPCSPMSLLLLCALRYIGRGWTMDDLEESTAISQEVIRKFLREFIAFGADKLYCKWVNSPLTMEEVRSVSSEYTSSGFPGCIGSMDATHVEHSRISHNSRQAHLSFKLPFTARSYNIVTDHRRRILGTISGHPARWNDKSLVKFDEIAMDLHEGKGIMSDFEFELYDYEDENQTEKKVKYRGAWILVDNGYLNWGVTIPPMKSINDIIINSLEHL